MRNRVASALLQVGLVAVALVALPYRMFELDRYFVPKELVLHIVALALFALVIVRAGAVTIDTADTLLALFIAWSTASALFATNYWAAQRALGVSVSSAVIFWAARRLGAAGAYRSILIGAAIATVCAAMTGLLQAYGYASDFVSLNRAPGGTFGNRNFVAHFCVIGLPALVYVTVTARTSLGALLGSLGGVAVAALLVLSRSRGAWLAIAATLVALAMPLLASRRYWSGKHVGGRFARMALAAVVGVAGAIALPNRLNWTSESPYLDSARGIVDYSSGSGRGRLAQYVNSMRMAIGNPVFGVGPGNWPVRYVRYAPANDRSLKDDGMAANPWPSSDWVAFVSERGTIGALALLAVFAALFFAALRHWSALPDGDAVLARLVVIGTIVATLVVSAFDAVLLLPAPAFLAWSVIGAASGAGRAVAERPLSRRRWSIAAVAVGLIVAASLARSAAQTAAIEEVGAGGSRAGWLNAAMWDPGSYRINMRVADLYAGRGQCRSARVYAHRALGLFPYASAPRQLLRRCG